MSTLPQRRWRVHGLPWGDLSKLPTWEEMARRYVELAADLPHFQPHADLMRSIVGSGVTDHIGGYTSMHHLRVLHLAGDGPRYEGLTVDFRYGWVTIRHVSFTGLDDRIERPEHEAVRLFWRFMDYKFDLRPGAVGSG